MSKYIQMRGIFKPGAGFEPSVMFLRPFLSKLWHKWAILSCKEKQHVIRIHNAIEVCLTYKSV